MKKTSLILSIIFLSISSACSQRENYPPIQDSNENSFELVKIVDGIDIPWGLAFTDKSSFLVTDKKGILYHVEDGKKSIIKGIPKIVFSRQGGLLDVAVDKNFTSNQIIYLTASVSDSEKGSNTSLFSAKLDGDSLVDLKQLYKASPDSEEQRHFGGSILLKNQHIYFTIGDRGNRDINPQDLNLDGGKIYRDGWQNQLYIREARRMISDYVMTQKNCERIEIINDPIGMAAYGMDSHNVKRYVNDLGFVENEGNVEAYVEKPFRISFRSIIPKKNECENLVVPVCLSASHIAFGSIRMEPVFMVLGQSSAIIANLAIKKKISVQEFKL